MEKKSGHDKRSRLGLVGAGRVAQAMARTWLARTGHTVLVWSRSGLRHADDGEIRIPEGTWVTDWTRVLDAPSIVIAIPGRAILDLAEGSAAAKQFTGNVFSTAASLSRESLQRVFPRATIVCISPFLINDDNSIPVLVLKPSEQWEIAKAQLEDFGELDVVEDEATFAHLSLLGAAWPAVVMVAVEAAARAGMQGLQNEAAIEMARSLFYRGIQSLLRNRAEQSSAGEIATPGGITERGLKSLGDPTHLFESVFKQMRARAHELRS